MRRGRVELPGFLDLGQPPPRAVEQLVTLGRRRACLKPSRHLAQLYRSFFDWEHRLRMPVVRPVIRGGSSGAPLKVERVRFTKLAGLGVVSEAGSFEDMPRSPTPGTGPW